MQSIPIASIRIENRMRPLDSAKVAELAASIYAHASLQSAQSAQRACMLCPAPELPLFAPYFASEGCNRALG
jgi:hypothetical protein